MSSTVVILRYRCKIYKQWQMMIRWVTVLIKIVPFIVKNLATSDPPEKSQSACSIQFNCYVFSESAKPLTQSFRLY
jgi:hypothetical protein